MKYLITVADDFGFSSGANNGSIEAYKQGIVTELSLMINAPGSDEAVKRINDDTLANVGIHLMLYDLNKSGKYIKSYEYEQFLEDTDKSVLEQRVKTELKKFEDNLGRKPSHISTHQYTHRHPKLYDVISEYAVSNDLFVRKIGDLKSNGNEADSVYKQNGVRMADIILSNSVGSYDELSDFLINSLKNIGDNTITEMFFYPAYLDSVLMRYSTLTFNRYRDLQLLTSDDFRQKLDKFGFDLVAFHQIQ
jgi:predicted glycoside hydrolase/deacetylase ChbG (UPF0249 family)